MSSVRTESRTEALIAALREYDQAIDASKAARLRLGNAEREIRRLTNAGTGYMDGNELVASLGRQLATALEGR